MNMKSIKTFEAFLREADEEKPKGKEGEGQAPAEEGPSIDKDTPRMKDFEVNGKTYKGVLSTFAAIAKKQEAMGDTEVGIITLPGDSAAYELFTEDGTGKEEDDDEEKKEEPKEEPAAEEPKKKKEDELDLNL
jgi:hypothetical protein